MVHSTTFPQETKMAKFVIERDILGVGKMTADELMGASQKSCAVLNKMGAEIQWIHSYVTEDKIYCIYTAPSLEMIEEHARETGFPANKISEVKAMIDPTRAG